MPVIMMSVLAPQSRQKKKTHQKKKQAKKKKDRRKQRKEREVSEEQQQQQQQQQREDGEQKAREDSEQEVSEELRQQPKKKKDRRKQRKEREQDEKEGHQADEEQCKKKRQTEKEANKPHESDQGGASRTPATGATTAGRQRHRLQRKAPLDVRGQAEEEEAAGFVATVAARVRSHPLTKNPSGNNAEDIFSASVEIRAFLQKDRQSGGTAARDWAPFLAAAYPEYAEESVEDVLMRLVCRCYTYRQSDLPRTECVEFWAGLANLTLEHFRQGLTCRRFDKEYSSTHDCLEPHGLRLWLDELCRTAPKCLVWNGTQCSSFVGLCVHQSKRGPSNNFLGDESRSFVLAGNAQMRVVSLIFFLSSVLGNRSVLEQPSNSCLPSMEPLRSVLEFTQSAYTITWLGQFGGDTPKPIQLWHTCPAYAALRRQRPRGCFGILTVRTGRRYSGKPTALKASQAYPVAFARAVADITLAGRYRGPAR